MWYFKRNADDCNYPLGVDPVWGLSNQGLQFNNNIKMKMSVIFGVAHMTIGIIMKGTNTLYFPGRIPSLIFEVIVGIIILIGLFGWMDLLVFGKWFFTANSRLFTNTTIVNINNKYEYQGDLDNRATPSVINIMINTVFGGGAPPDN